VDEAVAMLVETLTRNGQLDDTYLVFSSDNGFHLGQHRLPSGKQTAYEEDIRVPLVVRGPGVPKGRTVSRLAGNVDLAPTFADLARVAAPAFVDGRSLVPLLRGRRAPGWRRAYLVEHWQETDDVEPAARAAAPLEPPDPDPPGTAGLTVERETQAAAVDVLPEFHGIRTRRHLYVEYATGEKELYDLRRDPDELQNGAATARRPLLRRLAKQLARLKQCRAAGCRRAEERR
jgi:N-acetylglucosamine-6-sulfatase